MAWVRWWLRGGLSGGAYGLCQVVWRRVVEVMGCVVEVMGCVVVWVDFNRYDFGGQWRGQWV